MRSNVKVDIDLARDGKFSGYARVPHSVHRSANGWIPAPIVSIRNGSGKTILLMAGTHGDEYEGQVALANLARSLDVDDIQGQVIILPMANYPAARAGNRVSPLDDGNLARLYPGDPLGTPTRAIAHFIETELMSRADLVLDLHSGGSSLNYLPSTTALSLLEPAQVARMKEYMSVFGAPYGLMFPGTAGIGTSADAAGRNGILRVGCEMGGRGFLHPAYRQMCEEGALRILQMEGVCAGRKLPQPGPVQFLTVNKNCYVYAFDEGLFEPKVQLGQSVASGDLAGLIHQPRLPMREPVPLYFDTHGVVVCERPTAMCEPGDCLLHLAQPTD